MSNVKIELNSLGILELLSSSEVQHCVDEIANNCANSCQGNYEVETTVKSGRAVSKVKTADEKTYYSNFKTNELLKATSPNRR